MAKKSIYRDALPGKPTRKTSVDEDRWMVQLVCHTKSNHKFTAISWFDKKVMSNTEMMANDLSRMQRFCREAVDRHNEECGEKNGTKRVRKAA